MNAREWELVNRLETGLDKFYDLIIHIDEHCIKEEYSSPELIEQLTIYRDKLLDALTELEIIKNHFQGITTINSRKDLRKFLIRLKKFTKKTKTD